MGGITASNWKGRNVYKQKVPARNLSKTPAQSAQRRKFALLARLAGQLGPAIRLGFASAATSITAQNAFAKANHLHVTDDGTAAHLAYPQLSVSTGTIKEVSGFVAHYDAVGFSVKFNYTNNSNGTDALPGDTMHGVVIDKVTGDTWSQELDTRADAPGTAAITVGSSHAVGNLVAYAFYKRANSQQSSPTAYSVVV